MLQTLLHIVLWILAFLGITLLVLLGFFVLCLLLVLFVPLRYRGEFTKSPENMAFQVRVSWLLKLLRVRVFYEKEVIIQAFVLFFKVFDSEKRKHRKKKKPVPPSVAKGQEQRAAEAVRIERDNSESESVAKEEADACKEKPDTPDGTVPVREAEKAEKNAETKSGFHKLRQSFRKIRCQWARICAKIKEILQNIRYYTVLLKDESTAALFRKCKKRLLRALKSILPHKLKAALTIGFGSPDLTGYCMAVCGMLYPYLGKHVNIEPDFEKTILEGNIAFAGHITGFVLLVQALKLYFDKDLRNFIMKLKREES